MGNAHINFAQQILAKGSNVSPFQIEFFFGQNESCFPSIRVWSLQPWMSCYGVCEGVLLNFIISTDDKLSCIYINILNKGGYFHGNLQYAFEIFRLSERCDCLLDDFTWERMSDERRLKVVQVNKKSLNPYQNGGDMTSVIESAKYRLLSNVPILVYFFQS